MSFKINLLPQKLINRMLDTNVWITECPLGFDQMRLVDLEHYNFQDQLQHGQIIVNEKIAESTLNIFKSLFELKFPIHRVIPIHEYGGDDNLSMADNNSSGFNFRKIEGTKILSMHSYGLAIDINPVQNPYIIIKDDQTVEVYPKQAVEFLNRKNIRQGMVEPIIDVFKNNNIIEWGGNWNSPIDYHHFQVPRSKILTPL